MTEETDQSLKKAEKPKPKPKPKAEPKAEPKVEPAPKTDSEPTEVLRPVSNYRRTFRRS